MTIGLNVGGLQVEMEESGMTKSTHSKLVNMEESRIQMYTHMKTNGMRRRRSLRSSTPRQLSDTFRFGLPAAPLAKSPCPAQQQY